MNKSKAKLTDIAAWTSVLILTVAALYATHYTSLSGPLVAIVWILWMVMALALTYFTEKGKQWLAFGKDAKVELEKVVWPNRQETTQTTLIVIVMVTLTGVVLWGVDSSMTWAIGKITQLG